VDPVKEQGGLWATRAAAASEALLSRYRTAWWQWGWPGLFRLADPPRRPDRFRLCYWWQAHVLDALVDAQLRSPSPARAQHMQALLRGMWVANRGRIVNSFFDDMSWMGLALLRAEGVGMRTGRAVPLLWHDIRAAWNDAHGGGLGWSRMQPNYKNVPTNGAASVLAARLYRRDGDPADLDLARRLVGWIDSTLVDPATGLVWDGVGRQGDDVVDKGWLFTYTHGLVIAAHSELYQLTGEAEHAARVTATVEAVLTRLCPTGLLPDEGPGDGSLFRGILARYLAPLDDPRVHELLRRSGEAAWASRDTLGRFGAQWHGPSGDHSELSTQLSGVMVMEQLAVLERRGVQLG
jgi:predicted alpha-1,6-mannanase (GH76 family)